MTAAKKATRAPTKKALSRPQSKRAKKPAPDPVAETPMVAPQAPLGRGALAGVASAALEKLRRDRAWVVFAGGFWAKEGARVIQGRPAGGVASMVVGVLLNKGYAQVTEWKRTRAGKTARRIELVGGA